MAKTLPTDNSWIELDYRSWRSGWNRQLTVYFEARLSPDVSHTLTGCRIDVRARLVCNDGQGFNGVWCNGGSHDFRGYYSYNGNPASWSKWFDDGGNQGDGSQDQVIASEYFTVTCVDGYAETIMQTRWSYPYYNMTFDNTELSETVIVPALASPPSNLQVTNIRSGETSFTATVSVDDWGVGGSSVANDHYRELQVWTYSQSGLVSPRRWNAARGLDLTGDITTDNTSLTSDTPLTIRANTKYVIGGYATCGNGVHTPSTRFSVATTLAPAPTALSFSSQSYKTYSTVNAVLNYTVPADGGASPKNLQYRFSTDNGATYSDWEDSGEVVDSPSQTSGTLTAVVPTDASLIIQIRSNTEAGASGTIQTTFNSLATHQSPTIGTWTFVDSNASIVAITGDNTIFLENKSIPLMSISSSEITTYDGMTVSEVSGEFDNNIVIAPSGATYEMEFPVPTNSGTLVGTLNVQDSLGAVASATINRTVIPYSNPTVELTYSRIDDEGKSRVNYSGNWSPIAISGTNKNTLTIQYRLIDKNGDVIPWTTITPTVSGTEFSGVLNNLPTDFSTDYRAELKITDVFSEQIFGIDISVYNKERTLRGAGYDIEIWTRDNEFVADISKYIEGDLSMSWQLNDIEEVSFNISLDLLEELQNDNIYLSDLLIPYKHDVRIRRNGTYIIGCQIVETNIQIGNEKNTISVKATGYLNIFKDQYISMPMAGYPYPKMAHRLIELSQFPDCLIKNPTGDIDTSYWISDNSSIAFTTEAYAGAGAMQSITTGEFTTMATQMRVKQGETIVVDAMVAGRAGTRIVFSERELVNKSSNQYEMSEITPTEDNTYVHAHFEWECKFDNSYLYIQTPQKIVPLRADNVFVYSKDDNPAYYNQYVATIYDGVDDTENGNGHNYADSGYTSEREFNYELQNVKDAIIDLTEMGDDYFEFEFTPDKVFNTYSRKGTDRTDIEITYPGNVQSMTANVSASDMANKIQEIGSGIGDERLEVWATNDNSRAVFGNRESVVTANNVSLEDTLQQMADGELNERGRLINEISVVIADGSINCGNIQTGDFIMFRLENYLGLATSCLSKLATFEGWYRVMKIQSRISNDNVETLTLSLKWAGGFDES